MDILTRLKQLFCKHTFEKHYIPHGFRIVDGWMVQAYEYRCSKCGKTRVEIRMNMPRYIDADALLKELDEELDFETTMYTEEQNQYFNAGLRCAYRDVKSQPTADVVPRGEVAKVFEEIEEIITKPFTAGFDVLSPLNQALREYNNDIRKEMLYYVAQLKEKYTKGGEGE